MHVVDQRRQTCLTRVQASDQIASRLLVTLSVICVPMANDAEPVLPTDTVICVALANDADAERGDSGRS